MSPLAAKILLVGIPLIISLSWFLFWVLRITAAARKIKSSPKAEEAPDPPPREREG